MDRIQMFKFLLIALMLPAQYFISNLWSKDVVQRNQEFQNLLQSIYNFKKNNLELDSWKKWYVDMVLDKPKPYKRPATPATAPMTTTPTARSKKAFDDHESDELALEVLVYRKSLQYFAESATTRSPRPSKVFFKTGQVVKHKALDLYGVIIGWDEKAMATDEWLQRNYDSKDIKAYAEQPHYLVLVDKPYQTEYAHKAYLAQNDLSLVQNRRIQHNKIYSYFGGFDGKTYLKKKFLRTVYPHD